MVCFRTKNLNLGKHWKALNWEMFRCFMAIWNFLWRFGIFYNHLVLLVLIWYILPVLVSCNKKNLATLNIGPPLTFRYVLAAYILVSFTLFVMARSQFTSLSHSAASLDHNIYVPTATSLELYTGLSIKRRNFAQSGHTG
jgi:hypothetical protein